MTRQPVNEGRGGTIHRLYPRTCQPDALELRLALRCDNYRQMQVAYGEEACRRGLNHVACIVGDLFGEGGFVNLESADGLEAVVWDRGLLGDGQIEAACDEFIRSLCVAIAALPFDHDGHRIHLSFSGSWSIKPQAGILQGHVEPEIGWRDHGAFPIDRTATGDAWADRYRRDMKLAGGLLDLMSSDRLTLQWQRIAHAPDHAEVLYHEALLRTVEDLGSEVAPTEMIGALERLGLVRSLDQFVVSRVIDELEIHPAVVLGANISAQSAVRDAWWAEAERRLAGNRWVARRLVIEITETAALQSVSETMAFVDRMRALGCRIALDDFGVGHASIRQLIALKPDIVKVDGFFMRRAAAAERERVALGHIIGLAKSVAPIVVVEGVENVADSEFAANAGALWQQGWFCGRPGVARAWTEIESRIGALLQFQNQVGSAPAQSWAQ